jgi:methylated-DNA-[protein]-cysteine S-methyltransferase
MWQTKILSPVGPLKAIASERGLCGLLWPETADKRFEGATAVELYSVPVFVELKRQLDQYFSGDRQVFDLDLDLSLFGTEFQQAAWQALTEIPFGQTRTYSQQAAAIGRPNAVRAVGAANGQNPISIVVPCHRVIGKNGNLTGFAGGTDVKRRLLDLERSVAFQLNAQ